MPKVALTKQQRIEQATAAICAKAADHLCVAQALRRMDDKDFGPTIGICSKTWSHWRGTKKRPAAIDKASFGDVLTALYLAGYTVNIEIIKN